jgi:hypothetical protein
VARVSVNAGRHCSLSSPESTSAASSSACAWSGVITSPASVV